MEQKGLFKICILFLNFASEERDECLLDYLSNAANVIILCNAMDSFSIISVQF